MKVVLERPLLLGDVLYEPKPEGVEIPDEVKGKKVVLAKKDQAVSDKEIVLPPEARVAGPEDVAKAPPVEYPKTLSEATVKADPLKGPELPKTGGPKR